MSNLQLIGSDFVSPRWRQTPCAFGKTPFDKKSGLWTSDFLSPSPGRSDLNFLFWTIPTAVTTAVVMAVVTAVKTVVETAVETAVGTAVSTTVGTAVDRDGRRE